MSSAVSEPPVLIVGAGMAGLAAATDLARHRVPFRVLESGDAPGGRVRTDVVDGFPCDRGFQVFLPAYPTARRLLDYEALRLRPFNAGALIYDGERLHRFADPFQQPSAAVATALSRVVTFADKLRIAKLRVTADDNADGPDRSTIDELRSLGFSTRAIEHFFRPFFGGVFLDQSLETTARLFRFTFAMFARGAAAWPVAGMQAIPDQLAAGLPDDAIEYGATVTAVRRDGVTLADGRDLAAAQVILATDRLAASALHPAVEPPPKNSQPTSTTIYYTTPKPPVDEPTLLLNGSGRGRVNTVAAISQAARETIVDGRQLVSVALKEPVAVTGAIDLQIRAELGEWLPHVDTWKKLHDVTVTHALPDQRAGTGRPHGVAEEDGVLIAGDWRSLGSIEHALRTGREAASRCVGASESP